MNWKKELENIERKEVQELVAEKAKVNLKFEKVADRTYRVINTKTNRFYDMELGIDVVV